MSPPLRAVVFDFNGVILDDERVHYEAFAETLRGLGAELTYEAYTTAYLGLDDKECLASALRDLAAPEVAAQADDPAWVWARVEEKAVAYMRLIEGRAKLFPGVTALIEALAAELPLAIASGARRDEIAWVLGRTGLAPHFAVVISADEVSRGKPDPEGYTRAWRGLVEQGHADLQPVECLVIEDAPNGVTAAHAAGMRCLGVATTSTASELAAADAVVDALGALDPAEIRRLAGYRPEA